MKKLTRQQRRQMERDNKKEVTIPTIAARHGGTFLIDNPKATNKEGKRIKANKLYV